MKQYRTYIFFLLVLFLKMPLYSQLHPGEIRKNLEERGEVYVSLKLGDLKKHIQPHELRGFDRIHNERIFLCLNERDSVFLNEYSGILQYSIPPSMIRRVKMSDDRETVLSGKAYPTYSLFLEIMEYFREKYPEKCSIDTIGYSLNDRLLLAARLGYNKDDFDEYPVGFYSSTMHGDETLGYVLMLMLINHFLEGEDPAAEELMDKMVVLINPLENPDGTYFLSDTTVFGSTRGNARGVNLNRNYPDPQDGENPDGFPRQPESQAMMNYLSQTKPNISANFHGGAEVVNYPFDTWSFLHADDAWFRFISYEYADLASSLLPGYMDNFPGGITNGYEWYEVNGGRQDYVTYFLRGRETTIELSNDKLLPENEILSHWAANREPMINYLRQGLYGIHGMVRDSINGNPVKAEIILPDHDIFNSSVYSDSVSGKFYRFLKQGSYDVKVEAENYQSAIIPEISIQAYELKNMVISLLPLDLIPEETTIRVGPNPFVEELHFYLELERPGTVFIKIYDIYGMERLHLFRTFQGGYNEYSVSPDLPPGLYILKVRSGDMEKKIKIIKTR